MTGARTVTLLALLAGAALAAPSTGLSMEGHTGYIVTPSARVMPEGTLSFAWNRHFNDTAYNKPRNLLAAFGALPGTEIVTRFAYPDLSVNGKIGAPLYQDDLLGLWVGAGSQDLWGGAHLYHADYVVLTGSVGPLELTGGWGNGRTERLEEKYGGYFDGKFYEQQLVDARLEGWFQGASLQLFPTTWPAQASLLEDMDGNTWRAGARLGCTWRSWQILGLAATRFDSLGSTPEFQIETRWALPDTAAPSPLPPWKLAPVTLQFGPWMQSFVGTEVGNFDGQVALNSELHMALDQRWLAATRVRTLLWYSRNLEPGRPYHPFLQEMPIWWESSALGVVLESPRFGTALAQGGWTEGDNMGPSLLLETPRFLGVSAAMSGGAWYSPGWDETRTSVIQALRWSSPKRNWFGQIDAGRYWNNDLSARLRAGRRWGGLTTSLSVAQVLDTDETLVQGRISWNFSGEGLGNDWFQVRPVPVWAHGLRTKIATPGKELNSLRTNPALEPPVLLQIPD